jgi:hypothetical protein
VLTDFGIAQFEGDPRLTQTGMVMGSPGFTAPERIRGGDATHASDLWSLGATMYAAVEGRGPYEQRGGAITTMSAIINEDAPIAAHAGRLAEVIAALLRRDPAVRPSAPTAARMFAHVLSVLTASEETSHPAHPPTVASKQVPSSATPRRSAPVPPLAGPRPADPAAAERPASGSPADPAVTLAPAGEPAPAVAEESAAAVAPAVAPTALVGAASEEDAAPGAEGERAGAAEAEPGPAGKKPADSTPEAAAPAAEEEEAADDEAAADEAAKEAEPAPLSGAQADAESIADEAETPPAEAEALAHGDAATSNAADAADAQESAVEEVSAVEAVSAIEPLKTHDDIGDADIPAAPDGLVAADEAVADAELVSTGAPVDTAEPAEAAVGESGPDKTVIDQESGGDRPAERPAPVARTATSKPKPSPSFTAAKPGERSATPTFSAARPGSATAGPAAQPAASTAAATGHAAAKPQYGAPQYGPAGYESARPGSPQYGASLYANSYGGPGSAQAGGTAPYLDQSSQYQLGTGGGRDQRRLRPRWRIIVVIFAVLVAVAIGAGAAIALGHHGSSATAGARTDSTAPTKTPYGSVNALNAPSAVVPAGWKTTALQPAAAKTNAGFTVSLPPGWTVQRKGLGTYFHGPSDMLLEIDLTAHKYPSDMVREAASVESGALATGRFPDYHRAALTQVPVRGTKGAFWQFTWALNDVTPALTDDILFVMPTPDGAQSYAIYLRGRHTGWSSTYLPVFEKILSTFQTIPPTV